MRRRASLLLTVFLIWLGPSVHVHACKVPVFRYALERWPPGDYEVIIFHRGPLAREDRKTVDFLRSQGEGAKVPANVTVQTVDLAGEVSPALAKLWKSQTGATLPWLVVRYPESSEGSPLCLVGRLDPGSVSPFLRSPARQELARRLLAGQTAVWLLLECGN